MNDKDFLKLNPNRISNYLKQIIDQAAIDLIKKHVLSHVKKLLKLSKHHMEFAKSIKSNSNWRQKTSRAYYACYIASRAVRLSVSGTYDQAVSDHENIVKLPDDFPERGNWINILIKFKGDRNLCDYDHEASADGLEYSASEYVRVCEKFYKTVVQYLKSRGDL